MKRFVGFVTAVLLFGIAVTRASQDASVEASARVRSPELRFAVISDIHVQKGVPDSQDRFRLALKDLAESAPDAEALVINGDLGNGLPADYEQLGRLLRQLPHPEQVYYTMGNHEFYKAWTGPSGAWNAEGFPNGESDGASIRRFLDFAGYPKVYHDAWVEGYHFVFLGPEAYRQTDSSIAEDAWLSENQLQWLESILPKQAEAGKPIFVFLHQPLPKTVSGSQLLGRGVVQHQKLRSILSRFPQAILFTGHTHWELEDKNMLICGGFTMVNSSSVYEPYSQEDQPYGKRDRKSEGLTVSVYPDEVRIQGRDFAAHRWVEKADYRIPLLPDKSRPKTAKSPVPS